MGSILALQTNGGADVTMSSREIAELTKSSHDNVMKTIRRLIAEGIVSGNETPYHHPQNGQTYSEFLLSFRDTMVVVSGYNAELRARIIDRWQELERAAPPTPAPVAVPAVPKTFGEALRLAADQQDVIEAQAAQLAAAAPAVEFVDRYVESTGLMTFRQVAKLLKVKEPEFRQFLREAKIMYVLGGEWTAHAQHIEAGRFETRAGTAQNSHAFNACKFTAKGVKWVAGELAKWQLEQRGEGAHA
ncbi:phage antirepressor KilAC domain-containing protein [Herbaspirillum sp. SJZ107]|uniref:phage antirepressor KilAC domain-containing protein n=1 Tax=Herbaspirillum sp. SJZ107 TaxID=2572881 RepID=UPI00116CDBB9|nr:phage antirepressor KilAC domain-containing protein [Herbaspirillum sp. SJZ107]TQK10223.1 phage antirepressor YoqD-like protein [Herbaspirillum sp. SJZ107]